MIAHGSGVGQQQDVVGMQQELHENASKKSQAGKKSVRQAQRGLNKILKRFQGKPRTDPTAYYDREFMLKVWRRERDFQPGYAMGGAVFTLPLSVMEMLSDRVFMSAWIESMWVGLVRSQIEYYFSAQNLKRDTYLRSLMDNEGWVSIEEINQFPRMIGFGLDAKSVAASVLGSTVVQVSWDEPPCVRLRDDEERRTYLPDPDQPQPQPHESGSDAKPQAGE
eukprot:TRINITY_DN74147_c0_g1_i1.p1 TRINITY_DN74147_c0_g1~~TRINITY_DN74147_c0_g1_i1.p1  ORF type:complete len:234 (+),score=36.98 TRINITY_DN74147_c0_g1_i1:37-702(+)